jgi:hypothetical protein
MPPLISLSPALSLSRMLLLCWDFLPATRCILMHVTRGLSELIAALSRFSGLPGEDPLKSFRGDDTGFPLKGLLLFLLLRRRWLKAIAMVVSHQWG